MCGKMIIQIRKWFRGTWRIYQTTWLQTESCSNSKCRWVQIPVWWLHDDRPPIKSCPECGGKHIEWRIGRYHILEYKNFFGDTHIVKMFEYKDKDILSYRFKNGGIADGEI